MSTEAKRSRSKLWIGFGLVCVGVLSWVFVVKWTTASMVSATKNLGSYSSPAAMDAAMAKLADPMDAVVQMMFGYALSGIVVAGGTIVTAMGLIDYAAEVRARG